MKKNIIAVTGLNGSGKSTIGTYLKETHGFMHFSFRDVLVEILRDRKMELNRENMRELANEIRREHGSSYLIEKMLVQAEDNQKIVIESIRTLDEVAYLKKIGAVVIGVSAPSLIRYERITERKTSTDKISYQEFLEAEKNESEGEDGSVQNLPRVLAEADYTIENVSLDDTKKSLDGILETITKASL